MFCRKYPRGQVFFGIIFQNRNHGLAQNGAFIHLGADEMDGAAGKSHARRQGAGMGVEAFEGRQERGMDVQHPVAPGFDEGWRHQPHEPRQADKVDA